MTREKLYEEETDIMSVSMEKSIIEDIRFLAKNNYSRLSASRLVRSLFLKELRRQMPQKYENKKLGVKNGKKD